MHLEARPRLCSTPVTVRLRRLAVNAVILAVDEFLRETPCR
jgi:hypothetical protein